MLIDYSISPALFKKYYCILFPLCRCATLGNMNVMKLALLRTLRSTYWKTNSRAT